MSDVSSNMPREWIENAMRLNPCRVLESGNILTCPVRLSFPYLFEKQPPMEDGGKAKYALTLLFPFGADLSVLRAEAARTAKEKWPNAGTEGGPRLHSPFRDQAEKLHFEGYQSGAIFITASAERQPPVVDSRSVPVIDAAKAYPGAWALVSIRPFAFEKKAKKGVSFGLQAVMMFADDKNLGGGSVDVNKEFAGIKIAQTDNSFDPFS